jgi:hypothetical protein
MIIYILQLVFVIQAISYDQLTRKVINSLDTNCTVALDVSLTQLNPILFPSHPKSAYTLKKQAQIFKQSFLISLNQSLQSKSNQMDFDTFADQLHNTLEDKFHKELHDWHHNSLLNWLIHTSEIWKDVEDVVLKRISKFKQFLKHNAFARFTTEY